MKKTLAVVAPLLGAQSETFIKRHMQDLYVGNTVVIANTKDPPVCGHWTVESPNLIVNHLSLRAKKIALRLRNELAKRANLLVIDEFSLISEEIEKFLCQHNVSIILGEYLSHSYPFFNIARKLNIPYFAHAHGEDISRDLRDIQWQKKYLDYNQSAGIITINKVSKQRLINIGINTEKINIIPYGVDVSPLSPQKKIPHSKIYCLAVGRMVEKKAPILLLDAFRRANELCSSLHLDYVGNGELLPAVRQYITAFSLENNVTLHGELPNSTVLKLMQKSDIFLQHSITAPDSGDEEGLPVAILEAMANGLPVVSTYHAGIPEAVLEGKTGFLVNEGETKLMAEKIIKLANNSELRYDLGCQAWERAKICYTWENEKNRLNLLMGLS
jgi:colanic acid/amylovoran biosynthesis glycosyltransferase